MSLSGSATRDWGGGILYAPSALLSISGNARLSQVDLIVDELQIQGNGSVTDPAAGGKPAVGPQGPLGVTTSSLASSPAGITSLSSSSPSAGRPGQGASKVRVRATTAAEATALPSSKVTVYVTSETNWNGSRSATLLDSELLSDVAASLAAIGGSNGNAKVNEGLP